MATDVCRNGRGFGVLPGYNSALRQFPYHRADVLVADLQGVFVAGEQVHHFGEGGFAGHVAGTDDAQIAGAAAAFVFVQVNGIVERLGCHHHKHIAFSAGFQQGEQAVFAGYGEVAASESGENHAAKAVFQQGQKMLGFHARIDGQHEHIGAEFRRTGDRMRRGRNHVFDFDVQADFRDGRMIGGVEGREIAYTDLGGAVAAKDFIIEANGDFIEGQGGQLHGVDQIPGRITADYAHRNLTAGKDDGLAEVLKGEGKRRCGVGHSIGAVQNHEAIILLIDFINRAGEQAPVFGMDIGAVLEKHFFHFHMRDFAELRDVFAEVIGGHLYLQFAVLSLAGYGLSAVLPAYFHGNGAAGTQQ